MPAHATRVPPPKTGKHRVAVFVGNGWVVEPDFRGETVHKTDDSSPLIIREIGPLPKGVTDIPRPSEFHYWRGNKWHLDKKAAISYKERKILEERDQRLETSGFKVGEYWFYSDRDNRGDIRDYFNALESYDPDDIHATLVQGGISWSLMDGSSIDITPLFLYTMYPAMLLSRKKIFDISKQHMKALRKSKDPLNYDYSSGWPKTYEGEMKWK